MNLEVDPKDPRSVLAALTAKQIWDYARKYKIRLSRGCVILDYPRLCACACLAHMFGCTKIYDGTLSEKSGVPKEDLNLLEEGFENFMKTMKTNDPFFKAGAELYRLAQDRLAQAQEHSDV